MIAFGALLTLVIGFWLVSDQDYSFSELWLVLSLILWVVAVGAGQAGGMRDRETRLLAEELAAGSNVATPELRARHARPAHARALATAAASRSSSSSR